MLYALLVLPTAVSFGWTNYWCCPENWQPAVFLFGAVCLAGAIATMSLEETSSWKYFVAAVGFPAAIVQLVRAANNFSIELILSPPL